MLGLRAALVVAVFAVSPVLAQRVADPIEAHLAAAKKAAGFDFPGLLARICIVPQTAPGADVPRPPPPDRATWYTEPAKVFDNLYFVGTKINSSWALTIGRRHHPDRHALRLRRRGGDRRRPEEARPRSGAPSNTSSSPMPTPIMTAAPS